jgi:hypothetical protein
VNLLRVFALVFCVSFVVCGATRRIVSPKAAGTAVVPMVKAATSTPRVMSFTRVGSGSISTNTFYLSFQWSPLPSTVTNITLWATNQIAGVISTNVGQVTNADFHGLRYTNHYWIAATAQDSTGEKYETSNTIEWRPGQTNVDTFYMQSAVAIGGPWADDTNILTLPFSLTNVMDEAKFYRIRIRRQSNAGQILASEHRDP